MSQQAKPLAEVRAASGLSQFRLAVEANVSQSTIVNIEHYRQSPSVGVARRIADALGVSIYDIAWPTEETLKPRPPRKPKKAQAVAA